MPRCFVFAFATLWAGVSVGTEPVGMVRFGFDDDSRIKSDFVSLAGVYKTLADRKMSFVPGRFGRALHVGGGDPVAAGTWNESGLDCDLVVAVMWGEWREKPHFWGASRFHGDRGTVALWLKRETLKPGRIFFQCSAAWGRKEKELFHIEVHEEGSFSAALTDVQYRRHRIRSAPGLWRDGVWQHLAVAYDCTEGLTLYHDGEPVASNWGADAWPLTMYPGLFSLFLPQTTYDELYVVDRPLTATQIQALFESNRIAPQKESDKPLSPAARGRWLAAVGITTHAELPTVRLGRGLVVTQVPVERCSDDHIPAGWVMDGRYELAWPHPYTVFTFILGDVDYHGRKVDIQPRPDQRIDFVTFEGRLDNLELLASPSRERKPAGTHVDPTLPGGATVSHTLSEEADFDGAATLVRLSDCPPFFVSKRIDCEPGNVLRVPLQRKLGTPPGLTGNLRLPLSGPVRIHEIGLYGAEDKRLDAPDFQARPGDRTFHLMPAAANPKAKLGRYGFALRALKSVRDRTCVFPLPAESARPSGTLTLRPLEDLNLFIAPGSQELAITGLTLRLNLTSPVTDDVFWLRLRDPGNPSRIWSKVALRARFAVTDRPQTLLLRFNIPDVILGLEDLLWIELRSANGGSLRLGGGEPASGVTLHTIPKARAVEAYARHALLPTELQYSKMYNYQPWRFTKKNVTADWWLSFGGPWDMVYPPLAVLKRAPDHKLAANYRALTLERGPRGRVPEPELAKRRVQPAPAPANAPAWAVWIRELHRLNLRAATWIADRQLPDGQFWGGWNDDPFIVGGYGGLPLAGEAKIRRAWLRFYDGLDRAGIFAGGTCDIRPIDPLHITDFISYRGLTLCYALGNAERFERTLRTAHEYKKRVDATAAERRRKDLAPVTGKRDGPGTAFEQMEFHVLEYEQSYIDWYWDRLARPEPYQVTDLGELADRLKGHVCGYDELTLFAYTAARVHTDGQRGPGRDDLVATLLGGTLQRSRSHPDPPTIAVSWPGQIGPDLARVVAYADDQRLSVRFYNFAETAKHVRLRTWRLKKGTYRVTRGRDEDGDGRPDDPVQDARSKLGRFATCELRIPPRVGYVADFVLTEADARSRNLPDVALGTGDVVPVEPPAPGSLAFKVAVHNIGSAPAASSVLKLLTDDGKVLAEAVVPPIPPPTDLIPKTVTVSIAARQVPKTSSRLRVTCTGQAAEILLTNNSVVIVP